MKKAPLARTGLDSLLSIQSWVIFTTQKQIIPSSGRSSVTLNRQRKLTFNGRPFFFSPSSASSHILLSRRSASAALCSVLLGFLLSEIATVAASSTNCETGICHPLFQSKPLLSSSLRPGPTFPARLSLPCLHLADASSTSASDRSFAGVPSLRLNRITSHCRAFKYFYYDEFPPHIHRPIAYSPPPPPRPLDNETRTGTYRSIALLCRAT